MRVLPLGLGALLVAGGCGKSDDDGAFGGAGGSGLGWAGDGAGGDALSSGGGAAGGAAGGMLALGGGLVGGAVGGLLAPVGGVSSAGGSSGGAQLGSGGFNAYCLGDSYDSDLTDKILTCKDWSICAPGTYQTARGTTIADRVCTPCPAGTFVAEAGAFSCRNWSACRLGELEVEAPSSASDRTCGPRQTFPSVEPKPYPYGSFYGSPSRLAATSELVTLLGEASSAGVLFSYTPGGELMDPYSPDPGAWRGGDLVTVADKTYVVGTSAFTNPTTKWDVTAGALHQLGADGKAQWERLIGTDQQYFESVRAATDGNAIFMLALVRPWKCTIQGAKKECLTTDVPDLLAFKFDLSGTLASTIVLESKTNIGSIADLGVTSDGHYFVSATRSEPTFGERCDEVDPAADPTYYYYYCVVGVGTIDVPGLTEYDPSGGVVKEYSYADVGGYLLPTLDRNTAGQVCAFVNQVDANLHYPPASGAKLLCWSSGGSTPTETSVGFQAGELPEAFALTDRGLAWAGVGADSWPTFVQTNSTGGVTSRTSLPGYTGAITGVADAGLGAVYFGGGTPSGPLFVLRWPGE